MRRDTRERLVGLLWGSVALALLLFATTAVLLWDRPRVQPTPRQPAESTVRIDRPVESVPEEIRWHDPSSTWSASVSFRR